ncbi:MAG: RHS repeat-associated core domain-containing protein, partial [Verrucomicrobia bacterium]|nr:RHS repeat-associated core domain-containing protein [Verrucomicrobiota bacterium]
RVEKKVENLDGPTPNFTHRYVYDGWNLIAEYAYASSTLTLTRTYTWGLDIARSLTDAGGVGALLQIADHASGKAWQPAYDGNGNLAALVNGSTGTVAAVYEYSPYGELLRNVAPDSAAAGQPFRFSTKFTDDETGLVYYGHRFYSPSQGRFLGRDPKQEPGGLNLYGFCRNNSINLWDYLGMKPDWDGSPGDVETILEEIEPGVFAYVTYRWQFIETGSSGGEFDVYDWVQVGRPMSAGGRDSSGAEGSTRGLPESGGLYGTGLAMIPAFPFLGAVTATPPQATPSVPFEFISGGLRDDGDFNLYLALRYTGKDSLIVETTVSVRWGPGDNEVLNFDPIYSNLASNGSSSFQSTKGGSFTQVTPIGNTLRIGDPPETPQYLTNALGALGVNRPTSAGTITVNIRYAPGSLPVTGGLSESNARFFLNEYDHNRVGSAPPTGFSMGNATTQKMLISWNGAGDMTMRSTILVGGADRVGSPPIGKLVAPTSFPLP